jgi:MFS family permease
MKKGDSKRIKELKHHARRNSIREGLFATIQSSIGSRYISPFAIAINASNSLVALFGSVSGLLGPLSQLFSSRLMEKYSRKKIILRAVLFEALMWLPFILIGFLFFKGIALNLLPLLLILAFAIQLIAGNIVAPSWFSWIGDIVDDVYRGRWFSKRNLILGFVSIVLAITSSFFLDYFKNKNLLMFGFMILFALALFGRLMSWRCFKKQYEPKIKLKKGYYFSFWDFLIKSPHSNFGRFAIFRCFLAFSTAVISPLIAVYLLRNLGFGYRTYMIVTIAGSFFALLVLELWGKIADRFGNYKVIVISSLLIPAIPILWILNKSPIYLILIPSIVSGIAWAGFHLAAGNFIYDNVGQEKRGIAVSYYNMLLGIGTFLGAGLGAILIKYLNTVFIQPILLIFIISGILRFFTVIIGLPKMKEVRKMKEFKGTHALKNLILKEAKPTLVEEIHQIMSIKKYLKD